MTQRSLQANYLPQFIYGGIDGIITTFAIIAGVLGANLSLPVILILGFANLLADGFSMAASSYLSSQSEHDLNASKHQSFQPQAFRNGVATFGAFVLCGLVPLLPFAAATVFDISQPVTVGLAAGMTIVAFGAVGAGKAHVTEKTILRSVVETILIGGIAAVIAFGVGYILRGFA